MKIDLFKNSAECYKIKGYKETPVHQKINNRFVAFFILSKLACFTNYKDSLLPKNLRKRKKK